MFCPQDYTPYPWMEFAMREFGVREVSGPRSSANISAYFASVKYVGVDDSEEAWCSAFANWCLEQAGIEGTGSVRARSWLTWAGGVAVPAQWGCITVLARGGGGHVGFYVGEQGDELLLLGGNQRTHGSDAVCVRGYKRDRLLGYRWPLDTTSTYARNTATGQASGKRQHTPIKY